MSKFAKKAPSTPLPLKPRSSSLRFALVGCLVVILSGVAGYLSWNVSGNEHRIQSGGDSFTETTTQHLWSRFRWSKRTKQAKHAVEGELLVEEPYPFDQAEDEAPEEFFPRDPLEWQGLLVGTTTRLSCENSSQCPNAMACVAEFCSACTEDTDCGAAEVCSMDHCLPEENVACRSRLECDTNTGELCALSGYTSSTRGNEETLAYCSASEGLALFPRGVNEEEVAAMDTQGSAAVVPSPLDQLVVAVRASAP